MAGSSPTYPLYNTTFSLTRLSPLHHAPISTLLTDGALLPHAQRFLSYLRGTQLRGVDVSSLFETSPLLNSGTLVRCSWTVLPPPSVWRDAHSAVRRSTCNGGEDHDASLREMRAGLTETERHGVLIQIVYERITYTALLLRNISSPAIEEKQGSQMEEERRWTHLPLLMTRMPLALREALVGYLEEMFDTRASEMRVGSELLGTTLDAFLAVLIGNGMGNEHGERMEEGDVERVMKDVQVNLAYDLGVTRGMIKGLDITLSREDVLGFLKEGSKHAGLRAAEGPEGSEGPFIAGFSKYLQLHLAMDLARKEVRISRVGCGAFVLGAEGKVKIFEPGGDARGLWQNAVEGLLEALVRRARGGGLMSDGIQAA